MARPVLRSRRWLADWSARTVFVVTIGLGWWVVGWPGADRGHDTRLLYSGIVVVTAFLTAAMTQRAVMGEYAIKAGPIEVAALAEVAVASVDGVDEMDARLTALEAELAAIQKVLRTTFRSLGEFK